MKYISPSMLTKINKKLHTQANDADPRVNLVLVRTHRYIGQGAIMAPTTLWERDNLGPIAVAYRRENYLTAPDYIYVVYIEDGQAHVVRQEYIKSIEEKNEWDYLYTLGPAVDVAIEFDGRWHRTSPDAEVCFDSPAIWSLVTMGEPYFFRSLPDGSLVVQQGEDEPFELVSSGVTKIAAIRGWKNVYRWNHDHGLICAYVRDGQIYYRTFAMQGDNTDPRPAAWEIERDPGLPTPAQDVALFRTNDYRVGILAESQGEIHWKLTERNWAGMAIPPHTIAARGDGVMVDFIRIAYPEGYSPDHTVTATAGDVQALYCPAIWPQVESICNPGPDDPTTILVKCDLPLYGDLVGLQADFTVEDSIGTTYTVTATEKTDGTAIKLITANFEGAVGDLTVTYLSENGPIYAQVQGGCLMELDGFSETFTPDVSPPEGFTEHTITATGTGVKADFTLVTYHDGHTGHTITATAGDILIAFIHVDDVPP